MKFSSHGAACTCAVLTLACDAAHVAFAQNDLTSREEQAMKAAVARVALSVVRIDSIGGLGRDDELRSEAPTSGLIVSSDGYIVSSGWRLTRSADSILVTLPDGSRKAATLLATDQSRNLVLLKVAGESKLPAAEFAPPAAARVGRWALAVGRPFDGGRTYVSIGIVSALDRVWGKAIQTDAKISPNNYGGPLVDIEGRVMGLLVPLEVDTAGEVAATDWYDSGIGFAIPAEQVQRCIERLKGGKDLRPGLLGISFGSPDLFGKPARIAAARPNSPARKAGLNAGDKVVEVDGKKIANLADLKHAINPRYAGEQVKLVVARGRQRLERKIELVAELQPYEHPFLGILPMRPITGQSKTLEVRYVYPKSGAATAGLNAQDRIVKAAGREINTPEQLVELLQSLSPGDKLALQIMRGERQIETSVELGGQPASHPTELPPATTDTSSAPQERPEVGQFKLKIPEFANGCEVYVPPDYSPAVSYALIVWIGPPAKTVSAKLLDEWKPLCAANRWILVAPLPADEKAWQLGELRFIRRAVDQLRKTYNIDPQRIVAHGHQAGGTLAYFFALANPDEVRAVISVEAPLPRIVQMPDNDPARRLDILTTLATKSSIAPDVESTIKKLRAMKYPVTVIEIGSQERYLSKDELADVARWIDSLDRI